MTSSGRAARRSHGFFHHGGGCAARRLGPLPAGERSWGAGRANLGAIRTSRLSELSFSAGPGPLQRLSERRGGFESPGAWAGLGLGGDLEGDLAWRLGTGRPSFGGTMPGSPLVDDWPASQILSQTQVPPIGALNAWPRARAPSWQIPPGKCTFRNTNPFVSVSER